MDERDTDINNQIDIVRDERMILHSRLDHMQPKSWKQDAGMNEVPVWTAAQKREREKISQRLAQLAQADRALYRL